MISRLDLVGAGRIHGDLVFTGLDARPTGLGGLRSGLALAAGGGASAS